ncbi:MAG: hypothetical protein ABIN91_22095 [Mucilaginibacter sp.]|uniref:hypothetical protein n=1 Tax=Mucilaginibacter sp. TaxID=1882438 RepID=UPI0032678F20
MEDNKKHYHFKNIQTGNIIAYFTIEVDIPEGEIIEILENKRKALAVQNKLFYDTIYWEVEK